MGTAGQHECLVGSVPRPRGNKIGDDGNSRAMRMSSAASGSVGVVRYVLDYTSGTATADCPRPTQTRQDSMRLGMH